METTTLSRRRLLASMPAVAAAAAPVTATALTGLPTAIPAIPAHLDERRIGDLMRLLDRLDGMPNDDVRKVLTAITEVIGCSLDTHAHDAELMALKPAFDQVFDEWWQQHLAWLAGAPARAAFRAKYEAEVERLTGLTHDQGRALEDAAEREAYMDVWRKTAHAAFDANRVPQTDEEYKEREKKIEEENAKRYGLIDQIMSYSPLTRDGMRLQCRALIMDGYDDWNENVARFVSSFAMFFKVELPDQLADELMAAGWSEDDEGDEEAEVDAA